MLLWSDHAFDTKALLQLAAACAQSYGFQGQPDMLYTYQTKRGVGLETVVDWLLPYARVPSAKWPYMQILPFDSAPATATVCRSHLLSVDRWRRVGVHNNLPDGCECSGVGSAAR